MHLSGDMSDLMVWTGLVFDARGLGIGQMRRGSNNWNEEGGLASQEVAKT